MRRDVVALAAGALAALTAGCGPVGPAPSPTQTSGPAVSDVSSPSTTPTRVPSPTATAAPAPSPDAAPSLVDVEGRWCTTYPEDWSEVCVEIVLPEVRSEDSHPPAYVYPQSIPYDGDPRGLTAADYDDSPSIGECWSAGVDGYPSDSGAELIYCPAGAVSGWTWIDDLADLRGEDRLYMTQEITEYPYVRASG